MKITIRTDDKLNQRIDLIREHLQEHNQHKKITKSDVLRFLIFKESKVIEEIASYEIY